VGSFFLPFRWCLLLEILVDHVNKMIISSYFFNMILMFIFPNPWCKSQRTLPATSLQYLLVWNFCGVWVPDFHP
jgi:hypothetical protein